MMMATRGASAEAAPENNRKLAARRPRGVWVVGVAVHDRSRLQVVDGFGQLLVRLAIEDAGQTQVGEARRIFDIHVGRDANVVNRVARRRVVPRRRQFDGAPLG